MPDLDVAFFLVQQLTRDGWAELARFETYEEASELALSARAAGAYGIRVFDARTGSSAWSVQGAPSC